MEGYDLRLVDENGQDVADNEMGELLVRGESSAVGYWNQREKSRRTFLGEWTRTGDKYVRRPDGVYTYCGRTDDMFKVSGIWVSPFEVEDALITHPKVLEAAVVPVEDANGLIKPKAFVVLKNQKESDIGRALYEELKVHVKRAIGPWKYPRWIEFVDSLPKTATGKIQRFMLRDKGISLNVGDQLMPPLAHLAWPFFGEEHRHFGSALADWANREVGKHIDHANIDQSCRNLVRALGDAGWLKAVVPAAYGGLSEKLDVRTICAAREILSWHDSLADFAFAMQGLGTASISLFGSDEIKAKYLPPVRDGRHIAAFALSEPEAGSDVSALATTATKDGPAHVRLDGLKTWISNGGIADHYVVFARTGEAPGAKGLSSFIVDADTPGLEIAGRIDVIAPHPLATLRFTGCRVPAGKSARRFRRRLQGRDGDARYFPLDRRRRGARDGAPRLRRDDRARGQRAICSARRWRTCSSRRSRLPIARSTSTRRPC